MLQAETTFDDLSPDAAEWKRRLLTLRADRSPCPRLSASAWATLLASALDFVDRFGSEAVALGWTASQLFGVHPQHGTLRTDWCGALMLSGRKATAIDARCVTFGNTGAYRDTLGAPQGMPIWEFAAKQGGR